MQHYFDTFINFLSMHPLGTFIVIFLVFVILYDTINGYLDVLKLRTGGTVQVEKDDTNE